MTRDWRDERIEQLERENAEFKSQLVAALARIGELEEKLRKSSRNSGKPPSSDTPAQEAERKKKAAAITKPSGETPRKPGGQPGHERRMRKLVPASEVTRHHDCVPERCESCDALLLGRDATPRLHQVFHLPEVRPVVDQYAQHRLPCSKPECGHVTWGKLPGGVPTGQFGPSVIAVVTLLMGVCRLGKRRVQSVLADLHGLEMSLGAIVGCQELGSAALEAPVAEARAFVDEAPVKHSDETSWREGPQRTKVWLWAVVTAGVTVFAIHRARSADAARTLLGRLRGILVSDCFSAYSFWDVSMRQVCWAQYLEQWVIWSGGTDLADFLRDRDFRSPDKSPNAQRDCRKAMMSGFGRQGCR